MKNIIILLGVITLNYNNVFSQTPYDNFAPNCKKKEMLKLPSSTFRTINTDSSAVIKFIEFDIEELTIAYYNRNNSLITKSLLQPKDFKWLSTDPHSKNYPGLSPYNFVNNTPIRAVDPDGRDIYILFATTGNEEYGADNMFSASALTRQRNIENNKYFDPTKDKVVVIQISDVGQIKSMVEQTVKELNGQYGQTKEVGVWSHAGRNGPIGTEKSSVAPIGSKQMDLKGGWDNINFNWTPQGANMTFYGCNSGNELNKDGVWIGSFARQVSDLQNFNNIQVAGQTTSSYPSLYPFIRETTASRTAIPAVGYAAGDTYMVGGNKGEGANAMWFTPLTLPAANPLNVYTNGEKVGSGLQTTSSSNPIIY